MKASLLMFATTLVASASAFAVPGQASLVCQSAAGAKQNLKVEIARADSEGDWAPQIRLTVDGKAYTPKSLDIRRSYGETIHDATLGVIVVTANTYRGAKGDQISAQVMAVPGTVKTFDQDGKPAAPWKLENDDGGSCIDGYGKASFKGVFTGGVTPQSASEGVQIQNQILDCELSYDTGSAC